MNRWLIGIAFSAVAINSHAADADTPVARAYYFQDVEPSLQLMYRAALVIEKCMSAYPKKCVIPDEDAKSVQKVVEYVRSAGGPAFVPSPTLIHFKSFDHAKAQIRWEREKFNEDVQLRERSLFARVAAVNRVCPDEKGAKRQSALELGVDANFRRFWRQVSIQYDDTRQEFDREVASEEATIRNTWTADRCAAALTIGRSVLSELLTKARPNVEDASLELSETQRWALSYTTMMQIAYALQPK